MLDPGRFQRGGTLEPGLRPSDAHRRRDHRAVHDRPGGDELLRRAPAVADVPVHRTHGHGATTQTNAIWVLNDTVLSRPDPAWVGWPTAGWFPAPLEPAGRWSLSASDDSVSFANARVRVTNAAGQRLRTHVEPVAVGYGKATVVWQVRGIKATGVYHVQTVAKITSQSKPHGFSHTYIVRMFSPRRG